MLEGSGVMPLATGGVLKPRLEAGLRYAEPVGDGVFELRIHYGPGYRVYYGELERVVVILLCGGTKRSQRRDIERAKAYWQDLRNRSNE